MMDPSTTMSKLLRALQFRKHLKELTSACKRINQDACYEFVTHRHAPSTKPKKSAKFNLLRTKLGTHKHRSQSACRLSTRIRPKTECASPTTASIHPNEQHLAGATASSPANLMMIVKQSYKPLHAKSSQFNKNTIAVTKDTTVKALYAMSNWVFIELLETGQTGFVPIYCLDLSQPSGESSSQNNLSLLNVSIYEKSLSIAHNSSTTAPPGQFLSSIGPCQHHLEPPPMFTYPRVKKTGTYTRQSKDQSNLSRQISNMSLHAYDHDAYGTLNLTPGKSLSFSVLDNEPIVSHGNTRRLRVIGNYQRRFVGDISVLESEVVTRVDTNQSDGDWRLVRRGDGRQGYIPAQITVLDKYFN